MNRIRSLFVFNHPMQSQGGHKKEEHQYEPHVQEKQQHQAAKLLLLDFKPRGRPWRPSVPPGVSNDKIKQGESNADEKCAEEEIPEEKDLLVTHTFISVSVKGLALRGKKGDYEPSQGRENPSP
ncbi:MAG: hypothetical protein NTZ46_02900 [Verrucomicrobia bacterium]|nr:hypothetical protein [Verrucomicrobiota bacterium]